jgi:tetratricopeptide (TPR) repeat protein
MSVAASPVPPKAAACALVYSDVTHVPNINQVLEDIEEVLAERGFSAQRLGDEARTGQGYPESLRKLLSGCVLGVVVLDGLRPNVTYELGFLLGLNKPIIVLQSVHAELAVKTLFVDMGKLQRKQFDSLRNPVLRQDHFSDFDRTHVGFFDCAARKGEAKHLKTLLKGELDKRHSALVAETTRIHTLGSPQEAVNALSSSLAALAGLYYTKENEVDLKDLRDAWNAVKTLANQLRIQIPPTASLMASAAWVRKADSLAAHPEDRKTCLVTALDLCNQALRHLNKQDDAERWARAQFDIGYANSELSLFGYPTERNKNAMAALKQALTVYTFASYPIDFAKTQNNLGVTYDRLAQVERKTHHCGKAIAAYKQALKAYTIDHFPLQYAVIQHNLGAAYGTLSEARDPALNCRRAIAAYKQALKVYTIGSYPVDFAETQSNLGSAFGRLAQVERKAQNCRKAIAAIRRALKILTMGRFPFGYATAQSNLGNALGILAQVKDKKRNCRKAIAAFERAVKTWTLDSFPILYADIKNNEGNVLIALAQVKDGSQNCRKAIAVLEESARIYAAQHCSGPLARTRKNLARAKLICSRRMGHGEE